MQEGAARAARAVDNRLGQLEDVGSEDADFRFLRFRPPRTETTGGSTPVLPCDVSDDAQIESLFTALGGEWDGLDGVVHSIAYAPREALKGGFLEGCTREAFRVAHDVSAYSFAAHLLVPELNALGDSGARGCTGRRLGCGSRRGLGRRGSR